jgi:hypothetical protein
MHDAKGAVRGDVHHGPAGQGEKVGVHGGRTLEVQEVA